MKKNELRKLREALRISIINRYYSEYESHNENVHVTCLDLMCLRVLLFRRKTAATDGNSHAPKTFTVPSRNCSCTFLPKRTFSGLLAVTSANSGHY